MDGSGQSDGLSEEYLQQIRDAFVAYEESGDVFERARLVSALGKTHAPELLREAERLRAENRRLRGLMRALLEVARDGSEHASTEALVAALRDRLSEREWSLLVLELRRD